MAGHDRDSLMDSIEMIDRCVAHQPETRNPLSHAIYGQNVAFFEHTHEGPTKLRCQWLFPILMLKEDV